MNRIFAVLLAISLTVVPLFADASPVEGESSAPAATEAEGRVSSGAALDIIGVWKGAKLRCRKEQGKAVRCGKPASFEITFSGGGVGSSPDDRFPREFTYKWKAETEITITPTAGGDDLEIFQLTEDEGFLTFQAYIHFTEENSDVPIESSYIHYIFDVTQDD